MTLTGFENLSGSIYADSLTGDGNANVLARRHRQRHARPAAPATTRSTATAAPASTPTTPAARARSPLMPTSACCPSPARAGNDVLEGGAGDDILNGGGGSDTRELCLATRPACSSTSLARLRRRRHRRHRHADQHREFHSARPSTTISLGGDAGANILAGGAGHDFMRGHGRQRHAERRRRRRLSSTAASGDDILDGGTGLRPRRLQRRRASPASPSTSTSSASPRIPARRARTRLIGIEHVSGTRFNDVLTGNGGDNWIWGGSDGSGVTGNDILSGGGGNDLIQVGTGNHNLNGGTGTDTLSLLRQRHRHHRRRRHRLAAPPGRGAGDRAGLDDPERLRESLRLDLRRLPDRQQRRQSPRRRSRATTSLTGGDGDDTLYGDGRVIVDTHGTGGSGPIVTYVDVADCPSPSRRGNDVLDGGKGDDTLVGRRRRRHADRRQGQRPVRLRPGRRRRPHHRLRKNKDTIFFQGISGVDDFGDLTFTKIGSDVLITWGTGDFILLEGVKLNQIHAADFAVRLRRADPRLQGERGAMRSMVGGVSALEIILGTAERPASVALAAPHRPTSQGRAIEHVASHSPRQIPLARVR